MGISIKDTVSKSFFRLV